MSHTLEQRGQTEKFLTQIDPFFENEIYENAGVEKNHQKK